MSDQQKNLPPDQMRAYARQEFLVPNQDKSLAWIRYCRDLEAADREEAFQADDKVKANLHAERCQGFADAAVRLEKLIEVHGQMRDVLQARIVVALNEARMPAWKPTHLHYKGTGYRVLKYIKDANGQELADAVVYDDHLGNTYTLVRSRFEGLLESGKPRYQPIVEEAGLGSGSNRTA